MRIYLDHNATTPIRPEVIESMSEVLRGGFGNPSSVHAEGAAARARVEAARAEIADLLGVEAGEIQLTGGATESNNTVLFGLLEPGDHVVTTQIEHPSVEEPLRFLERRGVQVERVAPDAVGCVDAQAVLTAIGDRTRLVSMIWANNETGSIQPVEAVARGCRERKVLFHSDATQALGKAVVDLARVPVDFLSCSAHKLGGPKGVGALVRRRDRALPPLLHGGGQEQGRRGGTENVVGIAGFGRACSLAKSEGGSRAEAWKRLRDRLWRGIRSRIADARWNGDPERTLCNTLNVEFPGIAGEVLLQALDLEGIAVSSGAACHSGSIEPSKVLTAMGRTPEQARASLRLSVGWGNTESEIDRAVDLIARGVERIRRVEAP